MIASLTHLLHVHPLRSLGLAVAFGAVLMFLAIAVLAGWQDK
jgi:hypothetical protein